MGLNYVSSLFLQYVITKRVLVCQVISLEMLSEFIGHNEVDLVRKQ